MTGLIFILFIPAIVSYILILWFSNKKNAKIFARRLLDVMTENCKSLIFDHNQTDCIESIMTKETEVYVIHFLEESIEITEIIKKRQLHVSKKELQNVWEEKLKNTDIHIKVSLQDYYVFYRNSKYSDKLLMIREPQNSPIFN